MIDIIITMFMYLALVPYLLWWECKFIKQDEYYGAVIKQISRGWRHQ